MQEILKTDQSEAGTGTLSQETVDCRLPTAIRTCSETDHWALGIVCGLARTGFRHKNPKNKKKK